MGDKADDIINSLNYQLKKLKRYPTVKTKFGEHFVVRRNVIFERSKFSRRRQEEGETVDSLIIALHALAEHCTFRTLQDELVRNRIVVGLVDSKLAEKLQLDPELTLTSGPTKRSREETANPDEKRLQRTRRARCCQL